ncbi:hypothetical protein M153_1820006306 [Pseudoloma neurophilia]|uniref:Uncharacterized protein n=1 Tax=Pseudoloma neurophilia TaxID=146866 RepID=A0A0R0M6D7_9MICR|nr:hypothetical protein M153_1820006306 [Pseudoloma neurophilia]
MVIINFKEINIFLLKKTFILLTVLKGLELFLTNHRILLIFKKIIEISSFFKKKQNFESFIKTHKKSSFIFSLNQ